MGSYGRIWENSGRIMDNSGIMSLKKLTKMAVDMSSTFPII